VVQVPPGTYSVRATHPFFVTALKGDVVVASKAEAILADDALVLALNPGKLTGRVVKEVDGVALRTPAANVTVSSDNGSSTTTAMDGTFDLGGLPGGPRRLRFSLNGLHESQPNRVEAVIPGMTTPLTDAELLLDRGDVVGTVEMGDASPLRDVTVFLDGTSYSASAAPAPSDPAKGTFRIAGVPVGTYSLTAVRTGYRSVTSGAFTVDASKAVTVPALPKLTRVQGDFAIDDGDQTNTPGFTRTPNVLLLVNNPAGVASYRAAESDPSALPFVPFGADGGNGILFTLSPAEGEKTLFLQLKDAQNNLGPVLTATVVLDTTAPTGLGLRLSDGSGFTAQANPLPFSLSGSDPGALSVTTSGVAFMRLSLSATLDAQGNLSGPRVPYQRDDSFTRPTSAEGPVTLYAQLIDNAGNISAAVNSTVVVDVTAPSGSLVIVRGTDATLDGYTLSPLVTLQVTANAEPNGGAVRVRLANDLTSVDSATPVTATAGLSWFLDPLGDGQKTVSYRFVDSAGNLSPIQNATIVLDRIAPAPLAPATSLVTLGSASNTNSRNGSLTPTVADDRQMSPTQAVLLEVSGTSSVLPPTSPTTVTGSIPFTLPNADGTQTVRVRFKDAAGNTSASSDFSLTLDRVAPVGSFTVVGSLADGTPSSTITAAQVVKLQVSQAGATLIFVTAGALASCPASSASYLALTDPSLSAFNLGIASGTATVRGCLLDGAGNSALMTPVAIQVDTSVPTGCALLLSGTRKDGSAAAAGLTASPSLSASLSSCSETPTEVTVLEAGSVTCTAAASFLWLPLGALSPLALASNDGLHTLRGCVRDAARNVGSLTAASITLDTVAPTNAALSINADALWINASQVVAGAHTASLTGAASGAVEWAVGTAPGATNFVSFPGTNPRNLSVPVAADGTVTIYARFLDAVGNETDATDTIAADITAPVKPGLTVRPTGDPGFVNNDVVTVQLSALSGSDSVQLAEGATSPACTTAAGAANPQPPLSTYALVLNPVEGTHFVCGRTIDPAGNVSLITTTSVVLDKTAPTRPVIVTGDSYLSLANGQPATVDIASPSTDAFLKGYERLGGTASGWTAVTPAGPATRFALPVVNDGSKEGFRNELRLRAVDSAGNASAESSVLITADTTAPEAAVVDSRWVDNSDRQVTVYWQKPDAGDIARYDVFYDSAPGATLSGTYAAEGISPIQVLATGDVMSSTLSGLTNQSATYVQIIPVDRAGNRAPADAGLLTLQPNELSPNLVASVPLPGMTHAWAIEHNDGYLYVAASTHPLSGATPNCVLSGDVKLFTYDVRRLIAPIQAGTINAVSPPTLTNTQTFVNAFACSGITSPGHQMDIRIDPPWLFFAFKNVVRIYSIANPGVPALKATLTMPAPVTNPQLDVVGDELIVSSYNNQAYAISLASLFDNNAGTAPSYPASEEGNVDGGVFLLGAAFTTRDVLVQQDVNSQVTACKMTDGLDHLVGTPWNVTDLLFGRTGLNLRPIGRPVVSGNFAYFTAPTLDLTILPLNPLWTGTAPPNSSLITVGAFNGAARFSVNGDEIYLADINTRGLRVVDASDLTNPRGVTYYDVGQPNPTHVTVFGNYAAMLSNTFGGSINPPVLSLLELASPRSFNVKAVLNSGSSIGRPEVRPGLVILGGRPSIFDLHSGEIPTEFVESNLLTNTCQTGNTHFEDTQVQASGTTVLIAEIDAIIDRDAGTSMPPANSYSVSHPLGARITDVAAWGNYLVAAEVRSSGQQLWLEVYDARVLRDRNPLTQFSLSSPLMSFQVYNSAVPLLSRMATLEMTQGFAVLTFADDPNGATQPSSTSSGRIFVVDLKAAFDDDATTSVGLPSIQADFAMPFAPDGGGALPRMARFSGDTLYVAATRGLWAFPAAAVNDGVAGTVVNGSGATVALLDHAFDDLQVVGSTVIASPGDIPFQNQAAVAFDISASPTTLKTTAYLPMPGPIGGGICVPSSEGQARKMRGGVAISGSKAYIRAPQSSGKFRILRLE
jgi:hypothetical protein